MPNKPKRFHMVDRPAVARVPDRRQSAGKRGYTARWSKASKAFIAANPLCLYCQWLGRCVPTECTDHMDPVTGPDDPRFWDQTRWAPSCLYHNSRKSNLPFALWVELLKAENNGTLNPVARSDF